MGEPARKLDYEEDAPQRPNLRAIEGGGETTPPQKDHLKVVNDPYDNETSDLHSENLKDRESEGYGTNVSPLSQTTLPHRKEKKALDDKTSGGFYRHENGKNDKEVDQKKRRGIGTVLFGVHDKFNQKIGGLSNNKKKILFGVGLGGTALFIFIGVVIILFATLKIPNLAEHIASFQFARTARIFRQSLSQINGEKIAVDSMDATEQGRIKNYYEGVRSKTWGKLDKWRPELTYKNLQATGVIDYRYETNIVGTRKLQSVRFNGAELNFENPKLGRRIANKVNPLTPKSDIILAAQIEAHIADTLEGHHSLVRSSVAKKIYADLNIKLHWWDKQGETFKGTTAAEADLIELRDSVKRLDAAISDESLVSMIEDATRQAKEAQEKCLADDDCAKRLLESHPDNPKVEEEIRKARAEGTYEPTTFLSVEADEAIDAAINNTAIKVAETASTSSAILQGVCTIYDGSINRSEDEIDGTGRSAMAAFMAIASAGDQQKSGDTTPEAVGATNRKLGNISGSIPEKRAGNKNQPVSTDRIASPQAGAAGMFSLVGAIFGNDTASKLDPIIEPTCSALTSWQAGIGLAVGEIALSIVTGGGSKVAAGAGQAGAKAGIGAILGALRQSLISKQALGRMLGESAVLASLTVAAKMIVLSRMDTLHSGIARETDFANNADVGGNLMAQEQNRKILYGRPLTQPEVVASGQADQQYLAEQKNNQGTFERYFALSNPDSLLVNMGVSFSSHITNKQGLSQLLASSASRFNTALVTNGFMAAINPFKKQVALAQAETIDTNYQNVQWGWSEEELNLVGNDPNYFPLQNDVVLQQSGRAQEIETKYGSCFTDTMGTLLADGAIQRDDRGLVYEADGLCSPKNLSRDNTEGFGDLVFRWRLSKRNDNVIDHLTDIQNPTASNSASANPAKQGGGLGISSDGFTFPLKTTQAVVRAGKEAPGWCGQGHPKECGTGSAAVWCFNDQTNCHHDYNAADIFVPTGTPVVAAKSGKVIFGHNNPPGGTGSSIAIMGDDNNVYWYGHLKSGSVKFTQAGERVEAGTEIGQVGEDADAQNTPSHLHLDVQGPPATTREGCTNQACNRPPFNFLDIQAALVKAFEKLPS